VDCDIIVDRIQFFMFNYRENESAVGILCVGLSLRQLSVSTSFRLHQYRMIDVINALSSVIDLEPAFARTRPSRAWTLGLESGIDGRNRILLAFGPHC
jgi:hypothetical protein